MSVSMPNISDLVDITDTHGDMVPPEDVPPQKYPKYYECTEKELYAFRKRINDDQYCVVKYSGEESLNFPWGTRRPIKDVEITEEVAISRIKTMSKIKLEVGKTYLTQGGYIVPIVRKLKGFYFSTIECSPGITRDSKQAIQQFLSNCARSDEDKKFGWMWLEDGTIILNPEWTDKLKIVKELPFSLPPAPVGYQYAGGFPQFRYPKKGERFLSAGSTSVDGSPDKEYTTSNNVIYCNGSIDTPRLILEQIQVVASPPTPPVEKVSIAPEQDTTLIKNKISSPPEKPLSLLSYWITEPVHNTYAAAKKSVRYVVLWGVLSGIGYTAYNPAGVAKFVKSCLPKITVRYENETNG